MATETLDVFAVLANRLGAWSVKAELEDLAFKTLQPEDYEHVASAVAARAAAIDLPARIAQVRAALAAAGLDAVDVSGRVKNTYGVWKKLQKAGLGVDRIDEVYDVAALRVVVPHKHDCYRALREVEGLWAAVPGRFKDYIRHRKGNGYQSLHATVLAAAGADGGALPLSLLEIQIRTPKMHYIAEYGFAAHWRYKEKLSREDLWLDRLVQWKKWVAAEKLRIRDAKVRASGSPQRDLALAGLVEAAQAVAAAQASAGGDQQQQPAAAAAPSPPAGVSELDARFMARFSIQPVSEADLDAHSTSILVSGPRGVRVVDIPAGCTLSQLLAGRGQAGGSGLAVTEHEARGCSLQLNGRAVPLLARRETQLRPGDHVAFVHEPALAPAAARGASPADGSSASLPPLEIFGPPGRGSTSVEAALRRKLAQSTAQVRQAALAL